MPSPTCTQYHFPGIYRPNPANDAGRIRRVSSEEIHLSRGERDGDVEYFDITQLGQNLLHHPRIHFVIPGGGIDPDLEWGRCRPGFFLPVRVLSRLFRRLFLEALREAFEKQQLQFAGEAEALKEKAAFRSYLAWLEKSEWRSTRNRPAEGRKRY